ncbi:unnamed protein product [Rhizopus microsporus]
MAVKRRSSNLELKESQEKTMVENKRQSAQTQSWIYGSATAEQNMDDKQEDDKDTKGIKDEKDNTQSNEAGSRGIWSWLTYSAEPSNQTKQTKGKSEEQRTVNDADKEPQGTSGKRPFYWKTFFTTSTTESENGKDTVIVTDDSDDDNSVIDVAKKQEPTPSLCKNAILPTFQSQFEVSNDDSFLTWAINAIKSSIFTRVPSIIESMKQMPDDIGGKKIVIIGVHGWFPMKLVRSMIGEPTGTSQKFCEQMTLAVKKYFLDNHDLTIPDKSITSIPLLWEGKVQERVDKFYDLIQTQWIESIKEADIILWATHSQGTPVSIILLQKLIESSIIRPRQQPMCLLAMAGISHGPFPTLKGNLLVKYFEADPARELFEFMNSNSEVSIIYREAMAYVLEHDIKVVLVGSMQDQVVPLYSAIMSGLSHPNLLRAIYIDGHIYSEDDFLIRLIEFAISLLNMGLSDHGFLIYISEALAGNLYSLEGGHSTIYEELDVFILPLQYLFETHPIGHKQKKIRIEQKVERAMNEVKARLDPFQARLKLNPFHLPWAMRGIWDDSRILSNDALRKELEQLQALFNKWNPTSARLKEIKFRLEPLKARL